MLLKACASSRVIHHSTKKELQCPTHIYKGALIDGSIFHSLLYPIADIFAFWYLEVHGPVWVSPLVLQLLVGGKLELYLVSQFSKRLPQHSHCFYRIKPQKYPTRVLIVAIFEVNNAPHELINVLS